MAPLMLNFQCAQNILCCVRFWPVTKVLVEHKSAQRQNKAVSWSKPEIGPNKSTLKYNNFVYELSIKFLTEIFAYVYNWKVNCIKLSDGACYRSVRPEIIMC